MSRMHGSLESSLGCPRGAGLGHEIRRGADQHLKVVELAGDQRRVLEPGDSDGDVESFLDEVDEPVVRDDVERQFGMLLAEVDQGLADIRIDESPRHGDSQSALEVGIVGTHEIGEVVDLLQDLRCAAVIGVSGLGQRELARRAVQQQRAELVLEFAHIFRQQRLGFADAPGRGRKAFRVHDIDEGADAGQGIHDSSFSGMQAKTRLVDGSPVPTRTHGPAAIVQPK